MSVVFIHIDCISIFYSETCVHGCMRKFSVGHIQIAHTYFLPIWYCGRLWLGCWMVVHTCSCWFIVFIQLEYPWISSTNISFRRLSTSFLLLYYAFELIRSEFFDPVTCPWVCEKNFCGLYPQHTYVFATLVGLWKVMTSVLVGFLHLSTSIDLPQSRK